MPTTFEAAMRRSFVLFLYLFAAAPMALHAQGAPTTKPQPASASVPLEQETPGLLAKAKVLDSTARQAALARVPGGQIVKAELEQEGGKLIYSYDIKVAGKDGIEEVAVDAVSGAVIAVEHESAAEEASEQAADAKKKPS